MKKFSIVVLAILISNTAFADEPHSNCDQTSASTPQQPAIEQAAAGAAPVVVAILNPDGTDKTVVTAIAPSSIMGGAGGYGATAVSKGNSSVLTVAGITRAGSTKGYFAPATIVYISPRNGLQLGAGMNGVAGSSSPTGGKVTAAGDLAFNLVYTPYQTTNGKLAAAAMVNANVNVGPNAYHNGLTPHSGVNPDAIVTYAPNDNHSFTGSVARVISFSGDSKDVPNLLTSGEWDHQLNKRVTTYFGNQTATGNGATEVTPFGGSGITLGKSYQLLGSYSNDIYNNTGPRIRTLSGGLIFSWGGGSGNAQ